MTTAHRQGLAIGAGAAALALLLWFVGTLDGLERITWDWRARTLARPGQASDRIVLILLDQASLDWAEQENGLGWPWPRQVYVPLVDFCARAGARVLALDMVLTEGSTYGVEDDELLAAALAANGRCVGACALHLLPGSLEAAGLDEPIAEIAATVAGLANVSDIPGSDGVFRRSGVLRRLGDRIVPTLGVEAWRLGGATDAGLDLAAGRARIGHRSVRIDAEGGALLRFRGPLPLYRTYSAAAVIQSELRLQAGEAPVIDPALLRDAYVLFGFSAPGLLDLRPTPLGPASPGVVIHATVLDNLLDDDFMADAPAPLAALGVLLLAMGTALAVTALRSARTGLAAGLGLLLLPSLAGLALYAAGWWWPVVPGTLAAGVALIGGLARNYATEGRQRRFLKSAFRHYLSPAVIERILVDPQALQLGGERRELTIMFSDLAGFTALSEGLDPVTLTRLLNDYLTDMTDIVLEEGGTLDKYEGDAILAFWNAPLDQADHALRACRAAVRCQQALAARREEFRRRSGQPLHMRVGLHSGEVVVGNMGSRQRFDYTVLGDAANLASRLEGANKAFGSGTMISETTRAACGGALLTREVGGLQVIGRREPVLVHELLGLAADPRPTWLDAYEEGLAHGRAGRADQALAAFARAAGDPVASRWTERLLAARAAGEDFRGDWVLTSKG